MGLQFLGTTLFFRLLLLGPEGPNEAKESTAEQNGCARFGNRSWKAGGARDGVLARSQR
jgi:hypothetical protein